MADWLHAGTVGSPHGLDGSFHVSQPIAALLELGSNVLVAGHKHQVTRRAGTDARPILRLAGFDDRDAAQSLVGEELLVPRDQAPELEEDEWWAEDLEGCSVHDGGRRVGTVSRLLRLPSCDVLEVARVGGGRELLVPLVSDAVRSVDIERREIDVDMRFLGEDA